MPSEVRYSEHPRPRKGTQISRNPNQWCVMVVTFHFQLPMLASRTRPIGIAATCPQRKKKRGKALPWPAIGANVVLQRRLHGLHKPVFSCSLSAMQIRTCDTTARLSIRSRKHVNTRLVKKKTCSLGVPVSRLLPTSCAWLHDATGRMFSRRQLSPPNPDLEDATSS